MNERLTGRGIDVGHNKIHGDGVKFARTLEPFHHSDEGAELVAFTPENHSFSGPWLARELRKDVSDRLRRQKKAVPDDAVWPPMIGGRQADLITLQPYPDEGWFWGRHADLIARWRLLRSYTSTSRRNGGLPRLPSHVDVSWREEFIVVERQIINAGLKFEESILGWRDAWAVEAEVSEEALLQHLHRRALVREVLSAPAVIVTGIVRGIVTVVVGHPKLVMAVATCIAIFLLWDIIAAIAMWVWSGGAAFLGGVVGKVRDIIGAIGHGVDTIGRGIDAIGRSIDNTKRTIGDGYDAAVAFVKSPYLFVVLIIVFSLLTFFSISSIQFQRRGYSSSPAQVWVITIAILSTIALFVTLFAALIRYDIDYSKIFGW